MVYSSRCSVSFSSFSCRSLPVQPFCVVFFSSCRLQNFYSVCFGSLFVNKGFRRHPLPAQCHLVFLVLVLFYNKLWVFFNVPPPPIWFRWTCVQMTFSSCQIYYSSYYFQMFAQFMPHDRGLVLGTINKTDLFKIIMAFVCAHTHQVPCQWGRGWSSCPVQWGGHEGGSLAELCWQGLDLLWHTHTHTRLSIRIKTMTNLSSHLFFLV